MEKKEGEELDHMSKISSIVRYNGPALAGHSMDVNDLAPALLGLSEIVQIANKEFNGERSQVKILVKFNEEQKCFQFFVEVTQTLFQHLQLFVNNEKVVSAKELLEWIGIIGSGGYGLFKFYKWRTDQAVSSNELDIQDKGDSVTLRNIKNEENITINKNVYIIANNEDVLKNIKDVVRPLTNEGYTTLQFEQNNKIVDEISSEEGKRIYNLSGDALQFQQRLNKTTSQAKLKVKKPDLLGSSKWAFVWDRNIEAKIEDITWLEEFHKGTIPIPVGSFLEVMLRTEIELDSNNNPTGNASYYIVEVIRVIPPEEQTDIFTSPPSDS